MPSDKGCYDRVLCSFDIRCRGHIQRRSCLGHDVASVFWAIWATLSST